MDCIKWKFVNENIQQLEQTEAGRRIMELQYQGKALLENWVWVKTILSALIVGSIISLIAFLINPATTGIGAVVFILSFAIFPRFFEQKNAKNPALDKIDQELAKLMRENPKEKFLVERIKKLMQGK